MPREQKLTIHYNSAILVALCVLVASGACNPVQAQTLAPVADAGGELRILVERFSQDLTDMNWYYDVVRSAYCQSKKRQDLNGMLGELAEVDFNALSQEGRVDYVLLKNRLRNEIVQLDFETKRQAEIDALIPFADTIVALEEQRLQKQPLNAATVATAVAALLKKVGAAQINAENGRHLAGKDAAKKEKIVLDRALRTTQQLQRQLKRWFEFYNGYDPLFTWWVSDPYQKVDLALTKYCAVLQERLNGPEKGHGGPVIIGDPIGRDALLGDLALAMIPYTPEELIAIGEKEMAFCHAEMVKASREMGFGTDWHKALGHVKTLHVAPGEQPQLIRDLAFEAIDFLEKNDLITVPPQARESWKIDMLSPQQQELNPFFSGGPVISISFPTNTMSQEQKMMSLRGNNRHFCRATVHHELIPGHRLQSYMMPRYRPYRAAFETPFWVEGWALYWEMLLWDKHFATTPEDRMGMLFWRLHRCARIIFSLNFHLGKMTAQECIDFLVDQVGHEYANAEGEVRRSFASYYEPLYQCAYMIGGLQIKALRHEMVEVGKMSERDFHDRILHENSLPIELLRALFTNQPLSKEYTANWRFYALEIKH